MTHTNLLRLSRALLAIGCFLCVSTPALAQSAPENLWLSGGSSHYFVAASHAAPVIATSVPIGVTGANVTIWDAATYRALHLIAGAGPIAFSPDDALLASGSPQSSATIWRVRDGRPLHTLHGHTDTVLAVAFSFDGLRLATGGWDNKVKIWRSGDGAIIRTLSHPTRINAVAFLPDSQFIATGSEDGLIRIWSIPANTVTQTFTWFQRRCARSPRPAPASWPLPTPTTTSASGSRAAATHSTPTPALPTPSPSRPRAIFSRPRVTP